MKKPPFHLSISLAVVAVAATGSIRADQPIDFDTQVMAILTHSGCNAAACHGASGGQGGFQLSLFGSEPDFDYDQIVRERQGRRIHPADASQSLLLLKATQTYDHRGGERFDTASREYRILSDWIAQGAPRLRTRRLMSLTVEPSTVVLAPAGEQVEFNVTARFDSGEVIDVGADTTVQSFDEESLRLSGLTATVHRSGQHSVLFRFLDQIEVSQVILPFDPPAADQQPAWKSSEGFIDAAVERQLQQLGVRPLPMAEDASLVRRWSLDLLGVLPDPNVVEAFQQSSDPRKAETLVDEMLGDPRFVELWTWHLAEWLHVGAPVQRAEVAQAYLDWIRQEVAGRASLATLARQSLMANGGEDNGATGFFRLSTDPKVQAELAARVWMGTRIGCANCHNHPLDHWTRHDYYQFAAFFAGVRRDPSVSWQESVELMDPVTRRPAIPKLPDGIPISKGDPRPHLADWLTDADNPYFAASTANRIWAILMGPGMVNPVDDFRKTNPPSNPHLLQLLADYFRGHDFQLRPLIREIVLSDAYRRQSAGAAATAKDSFYWRFIDRPLPAAVWLGAIEQITRGDPPPTSNRFLTSARPFEISELTSLGQCNRETDCQPGANDSAITGLAENLERLTGPLFNRRIADPQGMIARSLQQGLTDREMMNRVYALAFSRPPTPSEWAFWSDRMETIPDEQTRIAFWRDALWAIISSREFSRNH